MELQTRIAIDGSKTQNITDDVHLAEGSKEWVHPSRLSSHSSVPEEVPLGEELDKGPRPATTSRSH